MKWAVIKTVQLVVDYSINWFYLFLMIIVMKIKIQTIPWPLLVLRHSSHKVILEVVDHALTALDLST